MKPRPMARHGQPLHEAGTAEILEVTTPEGVPLRFRIATAGARAGGVIIDYGIIFLSIVLLVVGLLWTGVVVESKMLFAVLLVAMFLILNFYFTFFEVRWLGSTPGKRVAGVRVINRSGGPLTGDAVLTRNFMRVVEVFVPLQMYAMFQNRSLEGVPWYIILLGVLWAFVLVFLPLFNKHRMRLGDIAAGTVVVEMPKTVLLADQGERGARQRAGRAAAYAFSREQLDVYGEYELQVLEELLRDTNHPRRSEMLRRVAEKISAKIGYERSVSPRQAAHFLQAYYEALRAHRERRMLFGRRKEDKHADEV